MNDTVNVCLRGINADIYNDIIRLEAAQCRMSMNMYMVMVLELLTSDQPFRERLRADIRSRFNS